MRASSLFRCAAGVLAAVVGAASARSDEPARELGRFQIAEPLGRDWRHEWVTREVRFDTGSRDVPAGHLRVVTTVQERIKDGGARRAVERTLDLPAQFYDARGEKLLADDHAIGGGVRLKVLFAAVLQKDRVQVFRVVDGGGPRLWRGVEVRARGARTTVSNGLYELELDTSNPLPINAIRAGSARRRRVRRR